MNYRKILNKWMIIDAIATALPFLFPLILILLIELRINLFGITSISLAEVYLFIILIDKVIIILWSNSYEMEKELKYRVFTYGFGSLFFMTFIIYILYLSFWDGGFLQEY